MMSLPPKLPSNYDGDDGIEAAAAGSSVAFPKISKNVSFGEQNALADFGGQGMPNRYINYANSTRQRAELDNELLFKKAQSQQKNSNWSFGPSQQQQQAVKKSVQFSDTGYDALPASILNEQGKYLNRTLDERRENYRIEDGNYIPLTKVPTWSEFGPNMAAADGEPSEKPVVVQDGKKSNLKIASKKKAAKKSKLIRPAPRKQANVLSTLPDEEAKFVCDEEVNRIISVHKGDIAQLEVDAAVASTNVSKSLFAAANGDGSDPKLSAEISSLKTSGIRPVKPGSCVICCGYNAPARFVIFSHAAGRGRADVLANCYVQVLEMALRKGIRTIALPCISTGGFGFPMIEGCRIALETIRTWLNDSADHRSRMDRIVLVLYTDELWATAKHLMPVYFPLKETVDVCSMAGRSNSYRVMLCLFMRLYSGAETLTIRTFRECFDTDSIRNTPFLRMDLYKNGLLEYGGGGGVLGRCRSLILKSCNELNDMFFGLPALLSLSFDTVQYLNVSGCRKVTTNSVKFWTYIFPNLQQISISECPRVGWENLGCLRRTLTQLITVQTDDPLLSAFLPPALSAAAGNEEETKKVKDFLILVIIVRGDQMFGSPSVAEELSGEKTGKNRCDGPLIIRLMKRGGPPYLLIECHYTLIDLFLRANAVLLIPKVEASNGEFLLSNVLYRSLGRNPVILECDSDGLSRSSKLIAGLGKEVQKILDADCSASSLPNLDGSHQRNLTKLLVLDQILNVDQNAEKDSSRIIVAVKSENVLDFGSSLWKDVRRRIEEDWGHLSYLATTGEDGDNWKLSKNGTFGGGQISWLNRDAVALNAFFGGGGSPDCWELGAITFGDYYCQLDSALLETIFNALHNGTGLSSTKKKKDEFRLVPCLSAEAPVYSLNELPMDLTKKLMKDSSHESIPDAILHALIDHLCRIGAGVRIRHPWLSHPYPKPAFIFTFSLPSKPISPLECCWETQWDDNEAELSLRIPIRQLLVSSKSSATDLIGRFCHHLTRGQFSVPDLLWARGFVCSSKQFRFCVQLVRHAEENGMEYLEASVRSLILRERSKHTKEMKKLWGEAAAKNMDRDLVEAFGLVRMAAQRTMDEFPGYLNKVEIKCRFCRADGRVHYYDLNTMLKQKTVKCKTFNDEVDIHDLGLDRDPLTTSLQCKNHEVDLKDDPLRTCPSCWTSSRRVCKLCKLCTKCIAWFEYDNDKSLSKLTCHNCQQLFPTAAQLAHHLPYPCILPENVPEESGGPPVAEEMFYSCTGAPFLLQFILSDLTSKTVRIVPDKVSGTNPMFLAYKSTEDTWNHFEFDSSIPLKSEIELSVLSNAFKLRTLVSLSVGGSPITSFTVFPQPDFPVISLVFPGIDNAAEAWYRDAEMDPIMIILTNGLTLEILDRQNPNLYGPAKIQNLFNDGTLGITFDGWSEAFNFSAPMNAVEYRPIGYSTWKIDGRVTEFHEPGGPKKWQAENTKEHPFDWTEYLLFMNPCKAVPVEFFTANQLTVPIIKTPVWADQLSNAALSTGWCVGQKLEAKPDGGNSLNPAAASDKFDAAVCTVLAVDHRHGSGTVTVGMDGGNWSTGVFSLPRAHVNLHPIGWAESTGLYLKKPVNFNWKQYLMDSGSCPVPWNAFTKEQKSDPGTGKLIWKLEQVFEFYEKISTMGTSSNNDGNKDVNDGQKIHDKDFYPMQRASEYLWSNSAGEPEFVLLPPVKELRQQNVPERLSAQSIFWRQDSASINCHGIRVAFKRQICFRPKKKSTNRSDYGRLTLGINLTDFNSSNNDCFHFQQQPPNSRKGESSDDTVKGWMKRVGLRILLSLQSVLTYPNPITPTLEVDDDVTDDDDDCKQFLEVLKRRVMVDYFSLASMCPELLLQSSTAGTAKDMDRGENDQSEKTDVDLLLEEAGKSYLGSSSSSALSQAEGNNDGGNGQQTHMEYDGPDDIVNIEKNHSVSHLRASAKSWSEQPPLKSWSLLMTPKLGSTLTELEFSGYPLRRIPPEIVNLHFLKFLSLVSTGLTKVEHVWKLPYLEDLDLNYNSISELPQEMEQMKELRALLLNAVSLFHWSPGDNPIDIQAILQKIQRHHLHLPFMDRRRNDSTMDQQRRRSSSTATTTDASSSAETTRKGRDGGDSHQSSRRSSHHRRPSKSRSSKATPVEKERTTAGAGRNVPQLTEENVQAMMDEYLDRTRGTKNRTNSFMMYTMDGKTSLSNLKANPVEAVNMVNILNDFIISLSPRLTSFPSVICELRKLRYLSLQSQLFTALGKEIGKLEVLNKLNLLNCFRLEWLPGHLGLLPLTSLVLHGCSALKTPPIEIVRRGHDSIMAFLKRILSGSKECKRTKLMLVGLGGAGKTSLVEALLNGQYKTSESSKTEVTDGIDIKEWSAKTLNQNKEEVNVHYSVWDFAGQSVYYNTHQFFLSNRAVYFLLWNTRLGYEHAGLEFWLSSISCHAPKARIFIVGTHADQVHRADLPKDELQKTFPQIVYFCSISAITGLNVYSLAEKLFEVTLAQSYMGEMVPTIWLQLEQQILASRRIQNILDYSEVEKQAKSLGMIDSSEVREALAFLHELGSVQYFSSDFLRQRVVINPQWLVDVMAALISVKQGVIENGRFHRRDIAKIWKEYPSSLHEWLLKLTEEFDLTFALPEEDLNIVPCLLSPQEPEYEWPTLKDGMKEMKMVYLFEYLPAGLFNRAQTRLCHYSDSHIIWKKGSLLHKNQQRALIRQTKDRELLVLVQGIRPENVLYMVHEVIEGLISEFFSGVSYDVSIPCADCVHSGSQDPHMFFARNIRRAGDLKAPFLQCAKNFHIVGLDALKQYLPPEKPKDLEQHLTGMMQDLNELRSEAVTPKVIVLCSKEGTKTASSLSPGKIVRDLEKARININVLEETMKQNMSELGREVASSLVIVAIITESFCREKFCSEIYQFIKRSSQRPVIPVVVAKSGKWSQTNVGMLLANELYVDMTKVERYDRKLKELIARIESKCSLLMGNSMKASRREHTVFVSYCWTNSADAVRKEGVLFEEIADALRRSKLMVACVSDQYLASRNCMLEYRFAVGILKLPLILLKVGGNGYKWEQSEIAMLGINAPRIELLNTDEKSMQILMNRIQNTIGDATMAVKQQKRSPSSATSNSTSSSKSGQKSKSDHPSAVVEPSSTRAYNEMCELAQRKFLQQLIKVANNLRNSELFNDPYPRLYVLDLLEPVSMKSSNSSSSSSDTASLSEEYAENATTSDTNSSAADNNKNENLIMKLNADDFCIRILCESEKGWHLATGALPIAAGSTSGQSSGGQFELSGGERLRFLSKCAPYLAPIYSIIQHSPVTLNLLEIPKILHWFRQLAADKTVETDFIRGYEQMGSLTRTADQKLERGGLLRGSLPSKRILWLCTEHLKTDARHVIDNDEILLEDLILDSSINGGSSLTTSSSVQPLSTSIIKENLSIGGDGNPTTSDGNEGDVTKEGGGDGDGDRKQNKSKACLIM